MTPTFRIALIAGDGIGKEVMPEGLRVLEAAAERFGFALELRRGWLDEIDALAGRSSARAAVLT